MQGGRVLYSPLFPPFQVSRARTTVSTRPANKVSGGMDGQSLFSHLAICIPHPPTPSYTQPLRKFKYCWYLLGKLGKGLPYEVHKKIGFCTPSPGSAKFMYSIQSGWSGCRTGNGKKLSSSQATYLAAA